MITGKFKNMYAIKYVCIKNFKIRKLFSPSHVYLKQVAKYYFFTGYFLFTYYKHQLRYIIEKLKLRHFISAFLKVKRRLYDNYKFCSFLLTNSIRKGISSLSQWLIHQWLCVLANKSYCFHSNYFVDSTQYVVSGMPKRGHVFCVGYFL